MEFSRNGWISVTGGLDEGGLVQVAVLALILLGLVVLAAWGGPARRGRRPGRWTGRPWRRQDRPSARGTGPGLTLVPPADAARARGDRFEVAAAQMRAVGGSGYERVPLLNMEEARLLPILERVVREVGQGHRVMAQTSLGEVIRPVAGSADDA